MSGDFGGQQPPPGGEQPPPGWHQPSGGQYPQSASGWGYNQPGPAPDFPGPAPQGYPGWGPNPPYQYQRPGAPPPGVFYKGSQYGLPWKGPGSLGSQWLRWVARFIDGLCLTPIGGLIQLTVRAIKPVTVTNTYDSEGYQQPHFHFHTGGVVAYLVVVLVVGIVAWLAYEYFLTKYAGRSVGKMAMGLRIVQATDPRIPVTPAQATKRVFVWLGFGLPIIGWLWRFVDELWCLGDSGRQCLHDKIFKTLVINTN